MKIVEAIKLLGWWMLVFGLMFVDLGSQTGEPPTDIPRGQLLPAIGLFVLLIAQGASAVGWVFEFITHRPTLLEIIPVGLLAVGPLIVAVVRGQGPNLAFFMLILLFSLLAFGLINLIEVIAMAFDKHG